jgi:acyl dehydratase
MTDSALQMADERPPLYYDDLDSSRVFASRSRTVTEADIVAFAGLSGDFFELHTSEEFARRSPYGARIAHGALVFSISTGLTVQMGLITDAILAFYGIERLRFTLPVFIGDTISVQKQLIEKKQVDGHRGLATFETKVINQRGDVVIVYHDKFLLKRRGPA